MPGTLPVLFFGDLFSARVATVGRNPSDQEYLDRRGVLLAGSKRRFATLASLGVETRATLSDKRADEAIAWMRGYYADGKPVYGWFGALGRVARALGVSFQSGSAVHLDLVQEATKPTWSKLSGSEHEALLADDLLFLEWQIRTFPLGAVVCTSKTVGEHVRSRLGVQVKETGRMALIRWWVGWAEVEGRRVGFAGWNYPLARPTGLGREGEVQLGRLIADRLGL